MDKSAIVSWIHNEFKPVTLATETTTIEQCVDNAFRYWNNSSAYRIVGMYTVANAEMTSLQIDKWFKGVVNVYPAANAEWVMRGHPLWTLLGIEILDNITSDMIQLSTAFQYLKVYLGTDFRFTFEPSQDPSQGGRLYLRNLPIETYNIAVEGTLRVYPADDIKQEYILDWLLRYSKALVKKAEGNTLRKSDIIGVKNDGQQLYDEGENERKELEERLATEGRWVVFARRF